jgi:hypothetical protein
VEVERQAAFNMRLRLTAPIADESEIYDRTGAASATATGAALTGAEALIGALAAAIAAPSAGRTGIFNPLPALNAGGRPALAGWPGTGGLAPGCL